MLDFILKLFHFAGQSLVFLGAVAWPETESAVPLVPDGLELNDLLVLVEHVVSVHGDFHMAELSDEMKLPDSLSNNAVVNIRNVGLLANLLFDEVQSFFFVRVHLKANHPLVANLVRYEVVFFLVVFNFDHEVSSVESTSDVLQFVVDKLLGEVNHWVASIDKGSVHVSFNSVLCGPVEVV